MYFCHSLYAHPINALKKDHFFRDFSKYSLNFSSFARNIKKQLTNSRLDSLSENFYLPGEFKKLNISQIAVLGQKVVNFSNIK